MTDSWQDGIQRAGWRVVKPASKKKKKKHNFIIILGFPWRSKSKAGTGLVGNCLDLVQDKKRLMLRLLLEMTDGGTPMEPAAD